MCSHSVETLVVEGSAYIWSGIVIMIPKSGDRQTNRFLDSLVHHPDRRMDTGIMSSPTA